jgi:dephospho-CoA kinase
MSSYNLIGICGLAGTGKNTLSDYLVKKYDYTKISFDENIPLDKKYVVIFFTESQLEYIKNMNGLTIKIQRGGVQDPLLQTDSIIKNNGTIEQLYEKMNNIFRFNDGYKKYNKYTKITNFDNITPLTENTLYVFDIDDTLMVYEGVDKNWLKNKRCKTDNEQLIAEEWIKYIENYEPKHTNKPSFDAFLQRRIENLSDVNFQQNIILLTARNSALRDITEDHLAKIGITNIPVYYSYGSTKGKILREIVASKFPTIPTIVFVDDNKNNIISVNREFDGDAQIKVKPYLIDIFKNT